MSRQNAASQKPVAHHSISGSHEKKTALLILPNTKSCGCG